MNNTLSLLQAQQQNAKPISGDELEVFGKKAANMWAQGCFDNLSDAVVGVVKEAGLSPEQVKRVTEFANVNAFLEEFHKEGSEHKYVDFGEGKLADYPRIIHDLNDGSVGQEQVDFLSDSYGSPPSVKEASVTEADWEQYFGVEEEQIPYENPNGEYYRTREKLAGRRDHLTSELGGLEVAYGDVTRELCHHTKQACMQGIPLGDVVRAWSTVNADPALIKCAFELVSAKVVDDEVFHSFSEVGDSITKTSSERVVNPQHPIVTSYQDYCAVLEKLAEVRGSRDDIIDRLAFIEYQFEKEAGGVVGALGRVGKYTGKAGESLGKLIAGEGSTAAKVIGKAGKYAPHAAVGVGGAGLAVEGKKQLEDSPTANLFMSAVPGTRQERMRREIRRQRKMMAAQRNPLARRGAQYMGGGY